MKEGFKDRFLKWALNLLIAVALVVGGVLLWPMYMRGRSLNRQIADLEERISEKRREIAALQENCRRFKADGDFVEAIAREKHRVLPGELVCIFQAR